MSHLCESGFNRELGFTVETKDDLREDAYFIWREGKAGYGEVKADHIEKI